MATYNTLPTVSEDALINEPKAPQNRMLALVAAVAGMAFTAVDIMKLGSE